MITAQTYNTVQHEQILIDDTNADFLKRLIRKNPKINLNAFIKRFDLTVKKTKRQIKIFTGKAFVCGVNK